MIAVHPTALDIQGQLHSLPISGPSGTGRVFFQGAHIVDWAPTSSQPVLWLSSLNQFHDRAPIRGGIPICLPWFGSTSAPRHGIARTLPWQLTNVEQNLENVALTFELAYEPTADNTSAWPHPFQARLKVLFGAFLTMTLSVTHLGDQPALYEPALHPYFQVGDIERVRISGLDNAPFTDHGSPARTGARLTFTDQGIDRIYTCSRAVTIHDDGNNRDIILHAPDALSRIIWNPGAQGSRASSDFCDDDWRSFLCLEFGNVRENGITLAPGLQHDLTARIQVVSQY
jgi:D-hexose-6-phosphate mutarotase